jgi:hypothetical protein
MIKKLALLAACTVFAACAATQSTNAPSNPGNAPSNSGDASADLLPSLEPPGPLIVVRYGDSRINATPIARARQGGTLTLKLVPVGGPEDTVSYASMNVFLIGSTQDAQWLNGTYNREANEKGEFDITVTGKGKDGGREYKYMVVIPGIGTIDPRVIVDLPTGGGVRN